MNSQLPKLDVVIGDAVQQKIDKCILSGQPYTMKLEIQDIDGGRYATEIDVLKGGYPSEAIQKASLAIFTLCDALPKKLTFQDCYLMATA